MVKMRRVVFLVVSCLYVVCPTDLLAQTMTVNGMLSSETVKVSPGVQLTVGVTGATSRSDWVALAVAGAANNSYVTWLYLNGTHSAPASAPSVAVLTFVLPATLANYEIRLFSNDSYTRVATTSITTAWPLSHLVVNGVSGSSTLRVPLHSPVKVDVNSARGLTSDWVGLYKLGTSDGSYVDWLYLNGSQTLSSTGITSASLTFMVPADGSTYEFRLFTFNSASGYIRTGVSRPVYRAADVRVDRILPTFDGREVVRTSACSVQVSVNHDSTARTDWVGLFPVGAAGGAYLSWQYLNGSTTLPQSGLDSATLTFDLPAAAGRYEFRLYSTTRVQTSAVVNIPDLGGTQAFCPSVGLADPLSCNYSVNPFYILFGSGGAAQTVTVSSDAGCPVTVSGGGDWLVVGTSEGSGTWTTTIAADPNTGLARSTSINFGSASVVIDQTAVSEDPDLARLLSLPADPPVANGFFAWVRSVTSDQVIGYGAQDCPATFCSGVIDSLPGSSVSGGGGGNPDCESVPGAGSIIAYGCIGGSPREPEPGIGEVHTFFKDTAIELD